jgi:hypothetical protein
VKKPTTGRSRLSGRLGASMEGKAINALRVRPAMIHENRPLLRGKPGHSRVGSDAVIYRKTETAEVGTHRSGRTRRRERPRWARTPESTARHLARNLATLQNV